MPLVIRKPSIIRNLVERLGLEITSSAGLPVPNAVQLIANVEQSLYAEDAVNNAVNVGTSSTSVLAARDTRKGAVLVNDSDEDIYLAFGGVAVLNQGIRLNNGGGAYEITSVNLWTGTINAIHGGSGNKVLAYVEFY